MSSQPEDVLIETSISALAEYFYAMTEVSEGIFPDLYTGAADALMEILTAWKEDTL